MPTEREQHLEEILSHFLKPLRNIPFELLIRGLFDRRVEPFDRTLAGSAELLGVLKSAMREVCLHVQANPIIRNRPNEVGNDMEDPVIEQLRRAGLDAGRPKTREGKGQSMGYPDIEIVTDMVNPAIYLEIKTFNKKNRNTAQRAFYLSPPPSPANAKINRDAHRLLAGFEVVRSGDRYRPVAFEVIDLYGLSCDVKNEIQSDNRRLYRPGQILCSERVE